MNSGRAVQAAMITLLAAVAGCGETSGDGNESRVLHDAEQILVQRCMRAAGFEYTPEPLSEPRRTFTYVLDDVEWAREHGYRSFRPVAEDRPGPNRRYFDALPADRKAAAVATLNGTRPVGLDAVIPDGPPVQHSDEGCTAESWRDLYRDAAAWFRVSTVIDNLPGVRAGLVTADARYAAGVRSWSDCMLDRGLDHADPAELHTAFAEEARPEEVPLAVAEAECAIGTGLDVVARELDGEYRERLEERYRPEFEERDRLRSGALERARAIVRNP